MKAGQWGGTELEMHPAFPLFCALLFATGQGSVLMTMLPVLLLHELGHVWVAHVIGVRVERLELMPFGGAAHMAGWRQLSPWQAGCIAMGGPAVNLLLAMCAIFGVHYGLFDVEQVALFVRCNLTLMLFNLLPLLPMDGGRLMSACLGKWIGVQRALRIFSALGMAAGGGLIALGAWGAAHGIINLTAFLSGAYLIYAALLERNTPTYTQLHRGVTMRTHLSKRGALPVKRWVVCDDLPIERLARELRADCYSDFEIVDHQLHVLGHADEGTLMKHLLDQPGTTAGALITDKKH